MKNSRDLILGEVAIYLSSIISLIRDLIYRMVTSFRFDHMIGESQQYIVAVLIVARLRIVLLDDTVLSFKSLDHF